MLTVCKLPSLVYACTKLCLKCLQVFCNNDWQPENLTLEEHAKQHKYHCNQCNEINTIKVSEASMNTTYVDKQI